MAKSGLASGLLSMSRMVGGTFGVAVLGAIFQASSSSSLESALRGTDVPGSAGRLDRRSSSAAAGSSRRSPRCRPTSPRQASGAAHDAFISGLTTSIGISAAVAAVGAVILAWFLIAKRPEGGEADGRDDAASGARPR